MRLTIHSLSGETQSTPNTLTGIGVDVNHMAKPETVGEEESASTSSKNAARPHIHSKDRPSQKKLKSMNNNNNINNSNNNSNNKDNHGKQTGSSSSQASKISKQLSFFQSLDDEEEEEDEDSEGHSEGSNPIDVSKDNAANSNHSNHHSKLAAKISGSKLSDDEESNHENDDASSTSSCSCEDHSSVADQSDADPHGDLDYDEDSITNSPTNNFDNLGPELFTHKSESKTASANSLVVGELQQSSTTNSKLTPNSSSSTEAHQNGLQTAISMDDKSSSEDDSSDDSADESTNNNGAQSSRGQRIKSFINFNHVQDEIGPKKCHNKATAGQQPKVKDRSHKSYQGLMKYFFKDACYFQIKSINHENVEISKQMGVWSTLVQNEIKLNAAFREHRNVILIFSVQQSGGFQGFARMVSEAAPSNQPVPWVLPQRLSNFNLGGVLRLEWLCTKELPFQEVRDLYNPFNDNKPVKVARDGQQVEPKVGKKLCQLFQRDSKKRLLKAAELLKRQTRQRKQMAYQQDGGYYATTTGDIRGYPGPIGHLHPHHRHSPYALPPHPSMNHHHHHPRDNPYVLPHPTMNHHHHPLEQQQHHHHHEQHYLQPRHHPYVLPPHHQAMGRFDDRMVIPPHPASHLVSNYSHVNPLPPMSLPGYRGGPLARRRGPPHQYGLQSSNSPGDPMRMVYNGADRYPPRQR